VVRRAGGRGSAKGGEIADGLPDQKAKDENRGVTAFLGGNGILSH